MQRKDGVSKAGDILWQQLRELPAFRALIRAIEARLLSQQTIARPMLDIGCGDGHYADVTLGKVDVGIDLHQPSLQLARRRTVYTHLDAASADHLPFVDGAFATVMANCAIEHMPDLDAVLREAARVLRRGGRFIFSVPTDRLNQNLLVAQMLDRMGLRGAAKRYREWFRRMQVHYHLHAPDEWQRRVEAVGFKVIYRREYLSPKATQLLELGHYYGVPNLIARKVFGKWVVWAWRPRFFLEEKVLTPRVAEDGVPNSSCCFFVAERLH